MYKRTRLDVVHSNMIQRCANPNNPFYSRYGGRSIKVCDEWSRELGISYNTLKKRVTDHGEDGEYLLRPSRREVVRV